MTEKTSGVTKYSLKRRIQFLSFFLFLVVILPLALLEGGMLLYISVKYGVPGKSYGLWRGDKVLGAIHQENAYNTKTQTNDFGFRNREDVLDPKPKDSWRVITYGGSTTFCYNLGDDDTWPRQLEKKLREEHNQGDQVLNGGAINWSLGHAYARAERDLPALQPDYVIIYSGINEETNALLLADSGQELSELLKEGHHGEIAKNYDQNRWVKRNLALVRLYDYFIKGRIEAVRNRERVGEKESPEVNLSLEVDPVVFENYALVLSDFIRLIKEQGAVPVFVIQTRGKETDEIIRRVSYSREGAGAARKGGAIVVDGHEIVRDYEGEPMDLFYVSGVHLSKEGASKIADLIYSEALRKVAVE